MSVTSEELRAIGRAVETRIGAAHGRMSPSAIGAAVERVRSEVGSPDGRELLARFEAGETTVVRRLVSELTVGETYFFREPAQIATVVRFVGEALARTPDRVVSVWSAGCASGEEPYSIAIRCLEAFGERAEQRVRILATDVGPDAVAAAERGGFRDWSFRATSAAERARWFDAAGRIVEGPRRLVRFAVHNLLDVACAPRELDVIVCRNVLLYFGPERALATIESLGDALASEGWLVLGPADPPPASTRLEAVAIGGKLYYRRTRPSAAPAAPPAPEVAWADVESAPATPAAAPFSPLVPSVPARTSAARIAAAHALADAGHEARALAALDALVREAPETSVHLARGILRSASGDQEGALEDATLALALDPSAALAHVLLASAHAALGDTASAVLAAERALALLDSLAVDAEVPHARGLRVAEVRETTLRILRSLRRARRPR